MREIKFRAWDVRDNKMVHNIFPFLTRGAETWYIEGQWTSYVHEMDIAYHDSLRHEIHSRRGFVMQYTGVKANNGDEIYDKDIVYVAGIGNCVVELDFRTGVSFYIDHGDYSSTYYYSDVCGDIEKVIGNVFENKELLEK